LVGAFFLNAATSGNFFQVIIQFENKIILELGYSGGSKQTWNL
jgi:hypothetical protein